MFRSTRSAWLPLLSAIDTSGEFALLMDVNADDERRNAARGLLRKVRACHGEARKGVAREAAGPAARSFRDRIRIREPERARDLIFADRARLRSRVLDLGVSAFGEAGIRQGRRAREVGPEQA